MSSKDQRFEILLTLSFCGGGWWLLSHFRVKPNRCVEVRLGLGWGFDKNYGPISPQELLKSAGQFDLPGYRGTSDPQGRKG